MIKVRVVLENEEMKRNSEMRGRKGKDEKAGKRRMTQKRKIRKGVREILDDEKSISDVEKN